MSRLPQQYRHLRRCRAVLSHPTTAVTASMMPPSPAALSLSPSPAPPHGGLSHHHSTAVCMRGQYHSAAGRALMQQAEQKEESELERKERAYLERLLFTAQHARDSVAEMRRLLTEEGAGDYVKQMDALAASIGDTNDRDALFSGMLSVQKMLSAVRRQVMDALPQSQDLVRLETEAIQRQPGQDPQQLRETKFRYLIGQHARKDDELRESMWDTYTAVAKRVFRVEISKAEDFLTDDRAIAVYIAAKRKLDDEMGSGLMFERILQSFKPADFNNVSKVQEFGDMIYAPLLFEREWEQLAHEEGVQKELLKEKKEREQQGEQKEEGEEKKEEEEKEIKLATPEGFINYKFIVAESLFRGRMRTVEPDEEKQQ